MTTEKTPNPVVDNDEQAAFDSYIQQDMEKWEDDPQSIAYAQGALEDYILHFTTTKY